MFNLQGIAELKNLGYYVSMLVIYSLVWLPQCWLAQAKEWMVCLSMYLTCPQYGSL